jgi:hypothetical protein
MEIIDVIRSLNAASRPALQIHKPVTSEIGLRAPQTGATYRIKAPKAQSIRLSTYFAKRKWYGSPYALQFSERAKREHSRARAAMIGNARR